MTTMSPGRKGRDEDLVDVQAESFAVDGPLDEPWRLDAIATEGGKEGRPTTVRHAGG